MGFGDKVLVIGDDTRSFLTIVRSLGRAGQIVHVAPSSFRSPALRSRYIRAIHRLPPYLGDGDAWRAAVTSLWENEAFDLAIPCDERALLPFDTHRDLLEARGWRVAMPDRRSIETLFDKHATRKLAARLGVDIAPGRLLTPDDTAEGVIEEIGLPLALKPRQSYRINQLHVRAKVVIIDEVTQLERSLDLVERSQTLIEAYIEGRGVGFSVLADRGIIHQAFEHHRIHDDPAAGGSYYRRSAPLSPDLDVAVTRIIAALNFTGVAMFEFRRNDKTGSYALLEVNARPWGSMPLAVGLGVDFPNAWRKLLLYSERTQAIAYRVGVHGRTLVPDLEFLMLNVKRHRAQPLVAVRTARRWLGELAAGLIRGELSDTIVRDDLRPGLTELAQFVGNIAMKSIRRLPGVDRLYRRWARGRALRFLRGWMTHSKSCRLVFVCSGNICRSPFAKELLQVRLLGRARYLKVDSSGTLPVEGRRSPTNARISASAFGVDLTPHLSRHIDQSMIGPNDVAVVFDEKCKIATLNREPALAGRTILLSLLTTDGTSISDPYLGDIDCFYETYRRIDQAIDRIVGLAR